MLHSHSESFPRDKYRGGETQHGREAEVILGSFQWSTGARLSMILTLIWCLSLRIATVRASRSNVLSLRRPSSPVLDMILCFSSSEVSLVAVMLSLIFSGAVCMYLCSSRSGASRVGQPRDHKTTKHSHSLCLLALWLVTISQLRRLQPAFRS